MQVQQRQHLGDLRGLARPRRQDRRGEPLPLAGVRVGALVVDPRRAHLDRARAGQHLPRLVIAVAHHQPAAVLVPLGGERGDVGVHLGLQRLGQHPPGALPHDLIDQRRRRPAGGGSSASEPGTTVSIGLYLPGRRCHAGHCLRPRLGSPGRYTPPGRSTGLKHCSPGSRSPVAGWASTFERIATTTRQHDGAPGRRPTRGLPLAGRPAPATATCRPIPCPETTSRSHRAARRCCATRGFGSEECLDLVDLSAGNVEGGVVLPYGVLVRPLQQAVDLSLGVVVELQLADPVLVGRTRLGLGPQLLDVRRRELETVVEIHELGMCHP